MGLKYEFFLIPMNTDLFKEKMLADFGIDETKFIQQENDDQKEFSEFFDKKSNIYKANKDDIKSLFKELDAIYRKQNTPEMVAYKERTKNTIQIWFRNCPVRDNWTICAANYPPGFLNQYQFIYLYYIQKFMKIAKFVIFMTFHSVSGSGTIARYYRDKHGKIKIKRYNNKRFEMHQYRQFLNSIANIIPYPIKEMDDWMNRDEFHQFEWDHHVRFDVKNELERKKTQS